MADVVEIDGNDGVGKTTVCETLRKEYADLVVRDRGRMTEATDDEDVSPESGVVYVLLDAPVETCRERLRKAGKDLDEEYHTVEDLETYRDRFQDVADRFNAKVIDADRPVEEVLKRVRHAIECTFCGGTGEEIKVVMGHEGLVSCETCGGTGIAKT